MWSREHEADVMDLLAAILAGAFAGALAGAFAEAFAGAFAGAFAADFAGAFAATLEAGFLAVAFAGLGASTACAAEREGLPLFLGAASSMASEVSEALRLLAVAFAVAPREDGARVEGAAAAATFLRGIFSEWLWRRCWSRWIGFRKEGDEKVECVDGCC